MFFLQQGEDGSLKLWVGAGSGEDALNSIQQSGILPDQPIDLYVNSMPIPFRVVSSRIEDGSYIYLGLSENEQLRILSKFRLYFSGLWAVIVVFGFGLIFSISRGLLRYIQCITDAASRIGRSDVKTRVPTRKREDEVGHLAYTLNDMLDRIESSMHQLHTMTDSLAHDIRSPITAIRGKLETSLDERSYEELHDAVILSIEDLDHLSQFLTESLDVAEASAGALRLNTGEVNLQELLFTLVDYYRPSFAERQMSIECHASDSARLNADAGLMHRMLANLIENELAHLPTKCTVHLTSFVKGSSVCLFVEDDGPGFPPELIPNLFERHTKGKGSKGHGLGLAFVDAVVRAHGGSVTAGNGVPRGVRIHIDLPIEVQALAVNS